MLDRENAVREIDGTVVKVDDYEQIKAKQELYRLLEEGLEDERAGRVRPFREAMADIHKRINDKYGNK